MKVSVAICTWNRSELLFQTLQRMKQLSIPKGVEWELILVDNASSDTTSATINEFLQDLPIRSLYQPIPGHSRSRNVAIDAAQGELILWTDNDVWVDSDWLAAYVRAAKKYPDAAYFGGKITPYFLSPQPRWLAETWSKCHPVYATRDLGDDLFRLSQGQFPFGANFAVRTNVQKKFRFNVSLGRSHAQMLGDDEIEMLARINAAGHYGIWIPQAKVDHLIPEDRATPEYISRYFVGQGIANLFKGKPTMKSKSHARRVTTFNQLCFHFKQHRSASDEWVSHLIRASIARGESIGFQQRSNNRFLQTNRPSKHCHPSRNRSFALANMSLANNDEKKWGDSPTNKRPLVLLVTDVPFWQRQTGAQQRIAALTDWLDRQPFSLLSCYTGPLKNDIVMRSTDAMVLDRPLPNLISLIDDWQPNGWWENLRWQGACILNAVRQKLPRHDQPTTKSKTLQLKDFVSASLRRRFQDLVREIQPDFVIIEYATLGYLVPSRKSTDGPLFILDTHDILSARNQQYKENNLNHWIDIDWTEEVKTWGRFDALMAIQSIEAAQIHATLKPDQTLILAGHPSSSRHLLKSVASTSTRADTHPLRQRPVTIGLLASANAANIDGTRWLINTIWPIALQQLANFKSLNQSALPSAIKLWIIGPLRQHLEIDELHPTISLQNTIDTLDNFYQHIDIAINPVRLGSGLKIKNIEALANAKPLLTTRHSAQGLIPYRQHSAIAAATATGTERDLALNDAHDSDDKTSDVPWIEFEDAEQAAESIVKLATDPDLRCRLSAQATEFLQQHLPADVVFRELADFIRHRSVYP